MSVSRLMGLPACTLWRALMLGGQATRGKLGSGTQPAYDPFGKVGAHRGQGNNKAASPPIARKP